MLFSIDKVDLGFRVSGSGLVIQPPSSVGLLERDIERWLAEKPNLLLPNEQLLVIATSVAGQSMADILALDALGRLVIVEISATGPTARPWGSCLNTLLAYAPRHSMSYRPTRVDITTIRPTISIATTSSSQRARRFSGTKLPGLIGCSLLLPNLTPLCARSLTG
jgi:hypothetical protein